MVTQRRDRANRVIDLIYLEGTLVDERKWDEWLALYTVDAEYWVPSWKSDDELVSDPTNEVSIAWYPTKAGIEDRIFRIKTGRSPASNPLPRTVHLITSPLIRSEYEGTFRVTSNFQVNCFRDQELSSFTGYYEHIILEIETEYFIKKKKITIVNDILRVFDIYCV